MDHELRRSRLRDRITELGLDALLVTHMPNVTYLTGFSGSSGRLVVGRAGTTLLVDGRYAERAAREAPDVARRTCLDGYGPASLHAASDLGRRVGFEPESVSFAEWDRLRAGADGDVELVPTAGAVEALRAIKDDEEHTLITTAQQAADEAFERVVLGGRLRDGVRERELALELEIEMRRAGADAVAFGPIVAFGENAAEPHHDPGDRPLRRGDVVKLDFGAAIRGYRSDMTRTVAFGEPGARVREIYGLVARAQAAGEAAVRDGVVAAEIDWAARAVIADAGLAEAFSHPVGHGVGLEIHEAPIMRAASDAVVRTGAVVTIEPGVYIPGVVGVRIEDMVEVMRDGCREIPRTSKELIVL